LSIFYGGQESSLFLNGRGGSVMEPKNWTRGQGVDKIKEEVSKWQKETGGSHLNSKPRLL
jgi:hypothetical protein